MSLGNKGRHERSKPQPHFGVGKVDAVRGLDNSVKDFTLAIVIGSIHRPQGISSRLIDRLHNVDPSVAKARRSCIRILCV